jgi:membrane protease YdiL (CAAX protease family)
MSDEEIPLPEEGPSGRVPHLGHALLFLGTTGLLLLLTQAVLLLPKTPAGTPAMTVALQHPKLLLAAEAMTYVLTLGIAWLVLPWMWGRGFWAGIAWNAAAARGRVGRLMALGLATGWTVQAVSSLIQMPKTVPMDSFFRSRSDVWLVTAFGTLLGPLFEEVCFRGFLLPACAIAWDWLGATAGYFLLRLRGETPSASAFGEEPAADGNMAHRSVGAVVGASLLTSALFAVMHAQQLGYTWRAVLLLACVSLVLTAVRLRTRSVACSALVHGSYNLSVFLMLFVATGGYRHLERMAR